MKILYSDSNFRVAMNSSDEIFVKYFSHENNVGPEIRISNRGTRMIITAHSCNINPTSVNGLDAFSIGLIQE